MIRIGYACLTVGIADHQYRTLQKKNLTQERLYEVIAHNLTILERMIDYNDANGIEVFRISSDLIPFGSSPLNSYPWEVDFASTFTRLAAKIQDNGLRFSFHPGQYTVLNSPHAPVVEAAIKDLEYHTKLIRLLGGDRTNKMVIHIGGIYGDKPAAIKRFINVYQALDPLIKEHLIIENDDKYYSAEDLADIHEQCQAPVVFDVLHHHVLPSFPELSLEQVIKKFANTWKKEDGRVKIHYSQQDPDKQPGAHSSTIFSRFFLVELIRIFKYDLDIMLEVKDKNLSAIKCEHLVRAKQRYQIKHLEKEWAKYKYLVLEHSPQHYNQIREFLKNKNAYPVLSFYTAVEEALSTEPSPYAVIDAANHIWGYFKNLTTKQELAQFEKLRENVLVDFQGSLRLKKYLFRLLNKYHDSYLAQSYYFYLDGFEKINY